MFTKLFIHEKLYWRFKCHGIHVRPCLPQHYYLVSAGVDYANSGAFYQNAGIGFYMLAFIQNDYVGNHISETSVLIQGNYTVTKLFIHEKLYRRFERRGIHARPCLPQHSYLVSGGVDYANSGAFYQNAGIDFFMLAFFRKTPQNVKC